LSVWLFSAIFLPFLAFFTEGLAFFEKINMATLGSRRLPHVDAERWQLWLVIQRNSDCR